MPRPKAKKYTAPVEAEFESNNDENERANKEKEEKDEGVLGGKLNGKRTMRKVKQTESKAEVDDTVKEGRKKGPTTGAKESEKQLIERKTRKITTRKDGNKENGPSENEKKTNARNSTKKNHIDPNEIASEAIHEGPSVSQNNSKRRLPKKGLAGADGHPEILEESPKKKAKIESSVPNKDRNEDQGNAKLAQKNVGAPPKNTTKAAKKKIKEVPDNIGEKQVGRKRATSKNVAKNEQNDEMENEENSENVLKNAADLKLKEDADAKLPQKIGAARKGRSKEGAAASQKPPASENGSKTKKEDKVPEKVNTRGKKQEIPKKDTTEKVNKRGKKNEMPQNDTKASPMLAKKVAPNKMNGNANEKPNEAEPKQKSRKRAIAKFDDQDIHEDNDEASSSKPKRGKKALLNSVETAYNKADFDLSLAVADNNISNCSTNGHQRTILKISSWNVAGLRSWLKKDGLNYLKYEEPDIFCIQEIKCTMDQLPEDAARIPGYHPYWLCLPGGYAGVALYSKIMPINVEYGIGNEEFDRAGRLITAEYEKFYLVNVYVPNSGRKLVNLEARMRWEGLFQAHVKKLDALKPVIITGDMNVSHQEIDLANPKSNTRSAGFTIEERNKMTELLALGFVDTYRHLYPNKSGAYTYWTYMANARARNIGWRLDYFLVSERIVKRVFENAIRSQCMGSDHCPITLFINM